MGGPFYVGAVGAAGLVVASGGTLVAAVEGAAFADGGGGLIGGVPAMLLHQHDAEYVDQVGSWRAPVVGSYRRP